MPDYAPLPPLESAGQACSFATAWLYKLHGYLLEAGVPTHRLEDVRRSIDDLHEIQQALGLDLQHESGDGQRDVLGDPPVS